MTRAAKPRASVICQQDGKVLLVRKAEAKWTLPGGKIEADEGPAEAALRELNEETGLASETLEYLATHEFATCAHHVFRLAVPEALAATPRNEIADCRWFSAEDVACKPVKRLCLELLRLYCQAPAASGLQG